VAQLGDRRERQGTPQIHTEIDRDSTFVSDATSEPFANRAEADRARAILLSLSGWKSAALGEVFGVREDTVRDWRSTFMREGLAGIERHPAPGRSPVKAEAALAVANELFAAPVENRINWTLPRLSEESSGAPGIAFRIRGSRWCCVKKGFRLQAAAERRSRGAIRPASSTDEAASAGGRYCAAVRR
jgi:transposase